MKKEYYTSDELEWAQSANIIFALKSMGYELKKEGHFYRGVEHNSMVINENTLKWSWNSRDLHGRKPVELLKQILIHDYGYDENNACITAIKRLAGTEGQSLKPNNRDYYYSKRKVYDNPYESQIHNNEKEKKGELVLPERNNTCSRLVAYLCRTRCIDYETVKSLIANKQIYETKEKHNVCFVSYDKDNVARHAFMRGTLTTFGKGFKQDVPNSDKSYGFVLRGHDTSNSVICYESAIDAISGSCILKHLEADPKEYHHIALNGLSPLALERFLEENPKVEKIIFSLDNDEAGLNCSEKLSEQFKEKGYKVAIEKPYLKDFNEDLLHYVKSLEMNKYKLEDDLEDDLERD